jgi:pyridinium-3,5-bisthiocarboxylic acid mononucleotide nickel chelatase
MKILYYDCFSGISGDMNLGAMIDAGVDPDYLINELKKLKLEGWELKVEKDQRHGISGTKVTVKKTRLEHTHRHLSDIEKIIENSSISQENINLSKKIFQKVANAEAKVHNIPVDKVHFHEVGAVDSIIDIVGAAICFNALNIEAVYISPVELGGGLVKCDHGILPVPAPATAEILKDIPVKKGGVDFEATTPTGAAILSALGTIFGTDPLMRIEKTGYGVGQKDHPQVPNLLRIFVGETEDIADKGHEALLIECNIDDMNPEFFEYISEKLFEAGASDVYVTNIIMKKVRPGIVLSVICEKGISEKIKRIIFSESTTLGIRVFPFIKDTLVRKFEKAETTYGIVTVKRSFYKGKEVSFKPEYSECRELALKKGIPLKEIYRNILTEISKTNSE